MNEKWLRTREIEFFKVTRLPERLLDKKAFADLCTLTELPQMLPACTSPLPSKCGVLPSQSGRLAFPERFSDRLLSDASGFSEEILADTVS